MSEHTASVENLAYLFEAPAFKRTEYDHFLFISHSRKLRRRVYVYSAEAFDLWVLLETDPGVLRFNERVQEVAVLLKRGTVGKASPTAASLGEDGKVTIHSIGDRPEPTADWDTWAAENGCQHVCWTTGSLKSDTVELANLKKLLRYVSGPAFSPDPVVTSAVMASLREVRKTTVGQLASQCPDANRDAFLQCVARQILDRKVFSDIHRLPYSLVTELSAYGDPTAK